MKKALMAAMAAGTAFAVWRKVDSGKSEQQMWAEATDKVS